MFIRVLAENTSLTPEIKNEHGLSLYIETYNHKILFDMGASGRFAENALQMGIDLTNIDLAVISHGHYDHGGGLRTFLGINTKANIYLHQQAFGKYFANQPDGSKTYIGLDPKLRLIFKDRLIFTGDRFQIEDGLLLFSGVTGKKFYPSGNKDLLKECAGSLVTDDFAHEQNLVIKEKGKIILLAGCAHCGIVNIIDHYISAYNETPDAVIAGFHLYNRSADTYEDPVTIKHLAGYLRDTGIDFYTGHCTGIEAFEILKSVMGDKIRYLAAGSGLEI